MRIGLDITKAVSPRDGIGYYTAELLRALAAELAAVPDLELWLYRLGNNHCRDSSHCRDNAETRQLQDRLADGSPRIRVRDAPPESDDLDLFHVTGWAVPQPLSIPLLYTCYDLTFLTHPTCHTLDNKIHCLTGVLQAQQAGATFLAISSSTARDIENLLGLAPANIQVIQPAAAEVFRPWPGDEARQHLRRRFEIDGDFALAVGTLEPRKNLKRLVAAYDGLDQQLKQRCPLLIAGGQGWKLDQAELFQSDHVRALGFVDRDDLVALYNGATVFAYPSLAEGFGLPVLEAMACGAPVITSNVSSLPEVAGQAAHLVDPLDVTALRDALRNLIEQPGERERLAQSGLQRAAAFSWGQTARQTLHLYHQIVNAT